MLSRSEIKEKLEALSKHHQLEALSLLSKNPSVNMNENNNGVFINLTEQDESVIQQLEEFLKYVDEQQKHLNNIDNKQEELEQTFFS